MKLLNHLGLQQSQHFTVLYLILLRYFNVTKITHFHCSSLQQNWSEYCSPTKASHGDFVHFKPHLFTLLLFRPALTSLHKCWLGKTGKWSLTLSQPGDKPTVTAFTGSLVVIIIIINPLTARVVGAPRMILQPDFSIFPCSPLPSGTCRTPGLMLSSHLFLCLPCLLPPFTAPCTRITAAAC